MMPAVRRSTHRGRGVEHTDALALPLLYSAILKKAHGNEGA